jgi:hypothetical protein
MNQEFRRMQELAGLTEIKVNKSSFSGPGYWNGWQLSYAEDNILYITPTDSRRPWIDGRVINEKVILSAEKTDGKKVEDFFQRLGKQLNATPYDGRYNNIELKVNQQDLDLLFNV